MNRLSYILGKSRPKFEIRIEVPSQWRGIRCSAYPMVVYILERRYPAGDFIVVGVGDPDAKHIILSGEEILDRYIPDKW